MRWPISGCARGCILVGLGDGSHPDDGIYVMLKEVIDNAVDEFIMGHGTKIDDRARMKRPRQSLCETGDGAFLWAR